MKQPIYINAIDQDGEQFTDVVYKIKMNQLKQARDYNGTKETFFKLSPNAKAVYVSHGYDRTYKEYTIENYETGTEKFIKSNRSIYIGFCY